MDEPFAALDEITRNRDAPLVTRPASRAAPRCCSSRIRCQKRCSCRIAVVLTNRPGHVVDTVTIDLPRRGPGARGHRRVSHHPPPARCCAPAWAWPSTKPLTGPGDRGLHRMRPISGRRALLAGIVGVAAMVAVGAGGAGCSTCAQFVLLAPSKVVSRLVEDLACGSNARSSPPATRWSAAARAADRHSHRIGDGRLRHRHAAAADVDADPAPWVAYFTSLVILGSGSRPVYSWGSWRCRRSASPCRACGCRSGGTQLLRTVRQPRRSARRLRLPSALPVIFSPPATRPDWRSPPPTTARAAQLMRSGAGLGTIGRPSAERRADAVGLGSPWRSAWCCCCALPSSSGWHCAGTSHNDVPRCHCRADALPCSTRLTARRPRPVGRPLDRLPAHWDRALAPPARGQGLRWRR